MVMDNKLVIERLKEIFQGESQEKVAERLNITQSTVSKILRGAQALSLEMAYLIADRYEVSADWLMGLSDVKKLQRNRLVLTYEEATKLLFQLFMHRAFTETEDKTPVYRLNDPLLRMLVQKAITLSLTDDDLYRSWIEDKLSQFSDKPVLSAEAWNEEEMLVYVDSATTEANWLDAYNKAKWFDDMYKDINIPEGPYAK